MKIQQTMQAIVDADELEAAHLVVKAKRRNEDANKLTERNRLDNEAAAQRAQVGVVQVTKRREETG
ncbi:hypothetical protein OnM2_034091 [Erysiphe neolycopersici]|uniref:Uncharacterized protein n=1 Tax=Erysiphe neolycopersici TaxID=212602 RepID=A0A420HY69_9PEZI|nr:hypothetical protein OnM2_034091 [Erysiphe neolycopersici]